MTNSRANKGGTHVVKKATETIDTSTTFQNDDELFVPLKISKAYHFKAFLLITSGTTPDFKYTFTVPSGASGGFQSGAWASGVPTGLIAFASTSGTLQTLGSVQFVQVEGYVIMSTTAGNLTLQWAQNTSDGGDTTVLAGSLLEVFEE